MKTGEGVIEVFISPRDGHRHEFPSVNAGTDVSDESSKISRPPQALLDFKTQSYSPQVLTIGPFYQMLDGSRSFDHYKAPCVDAFMRRHRISDKEELMRRLNYEPLHMHY